MIDLSFMALVLITLCERYYCKDSKHKCFGIKFWFTAGVTTCDWKLDLRMHFGRNFQDEAYQILLNCKVTL
jgi:hypothetical protein